MSRIWVQPHARTRRRKDLTRLSKFYFFIYILTLTKEKIGEALSSTSKLNLNSRSCLFTKKTSIQFGFTWFTIWDANLLVFNHSANLEKENGNQGKKKFGLVCDHIASCSHQGEEYMKRHIQQALHEKKSKSLISMKTLSSFGFRPNADSIREQIKNCYVAVGIYFQYKNCLLITFFYLFCKLFYV